MTCVSQAIASFQLFRKNSVKYDRDGGILVLVLG
jgi:hypothetical protein